MPDIIHPTPPTPLELERRAMADMALTEYRRHHTAAPLGAWKRSAIGDVWGRQLVVPPSASGEPERIVVYRIRFDPGAATVASISVADRGPAIGWHPARAA